MALSYKTIGIRFDDTDGTTERGILVPPDGHAFLAQGIRAYVIAPNAQGTDNTINLDIRMLTEAGQTYRIKRVPLVTGVAEYTVDLMPYLSNLASYGVAAPAAIRCALTEGLVAGNFVTIHGFALRDSVV